jgi:transposase
MLSTIPGISSLSAETIVAEIGIDMSRFPTAGHLISWAGFALAMTRALASVVPPA